MQGAASAARGRLTRRAALTTLVSASGLLLLAACAVAPTPAAPAATSAPPPAPTNPATGSGTTAAPAATVAPAAAPAGAQPRPGGTLRTGLLTDLNTLDPHAGSVPSHETVFLAFDHLTAYNEQLEPQPRLAESWDVSSDLKQIKFNLRKGVQFHTGREFTSDDVKWNMLRVRDPKSSSTSFANQSKWFTTLDTPDKYTLIVGSDQPRPAAFDFFEFLNIADPLTMESPDAATKVVGTGPFRFVEWAQGDHITMARNPSYWQSGRPYLDTVVATIMRDPQAQIIQLETGTLDAIKNPSLRDAARLKSDAKYSALLHPFSGTFYMQGVNVQKPPFDNKKVRQALSFAIDRQRIVDTVLLGLSQPQSLPWLSFSPAFEASKEHSFTFDLDRARGLLAEAVVSNLTTEVIPIPTNPELVDMAQIYQADLARIGVTLNVKQVEAATWFDLANNRNYQGFYSTLNGLAQMEPVTLLLGGRVYDPVSNNSGFKNDAYEQLLNQAAAEPDKARRKALYAQVNDVLLDEAFAMPIAAGQTRMLTRAAVHGVGFNMWNGSFSYTNAWLEG